MKNDRLLIFLPIAAILLIAVVFIMLFVANNTLGKRIEEQNKTIDSLNSEIFCFQVQIQRYEGIYDLLDEGCQNQYDSVSNFVE